MEFNASDGVVVSFVFTRVVTVAPHPALGRPSCVPSVHQLVHHGHADHGVVVAAVHLRWNGYFYIDRYLMCLCGRREKGGGCWGGCVLVESER